MAGVEPAADEALVGAARALGPLIERCGDEIERERRLPQPLFDQMTRAGLFRMLVPRALGGGEASPETLVRVVEAVSRADGSAGWLVNIGATSGIFAGVL